MRRHSVLQRAVLLASTPFVLGSGAPSPRSSDAQTFDVITLSSPRARPNGRFGRSVAGAGDVDRDGHPDVVVGAPLDGPERRGGVYVFSGRDSSLLLEIAPPNAGAEGGFGYAVAGVGDVNQDGFDDLIVGATTSVPELGQDGRRRPDMFIGRAYIFSGKDGVLLFELEANVNLKGFGALGTSVAGAGDVDADGAPDVVVGTGWATSVQDPRNCGRVYVFSGRTGIVIFELIPPNKEQDGRFGDSVGGVGDLDHDGHADVIVGAWGEDPDTSPGNAGRAYVFSGRDRSLLLELRSPNEEMSGFFGWSVGGPGDVDQDGTPDALVAALAEDPGTSPRDSGRAYVFSGKDGSVLFELESPSPEVRGHFGWSTAAAGDIDGDGQPDVIVGALWEDPGASPADTGRAYLFSGRDGGLLLAIRSRDPQAGGNFGTSVAGAGDVNQDGLADLVVGAPGENGQAGRAYLLVSRAAPSEPEANPEARDEGQRPEALLDEGLPGGAGRRPGRLLEIDEGRVASVQDVDHVQVELPLPRAPASEMTRPEVQARAEGKTP